MPRDRALPRGRRRRGGLAAGPPGRGACAARRSPCWSRIRAPLASWRGPAAAPTGGVRASAALALGNRGEPRAVLLEMASDPEAQVRSCALGALAHVGMDGARGKALAGLADPEIGVRRAALQACAKLGVAGARRRSRAARVGGRRGAGPDRANSARRAVTPAHRPTARIRIAGANNKNPRANPWLR